MCECCHPLMENTLDVEDASESMNLPVSNNR